MKALVIALAALATSPAYAFDVVARCQQSDYVTVDGNTRIAFAGSSYTPKCITIKKGTTVTIAASTVHPLQGILAADGSANPIFDDLGGAVQNKTVTFDEAGIFGYYCVAHSDDQGNGMAGAIQVVE